MPSFSRPWLLLFATMFALFSAGRADAGQASLTAKIKLNNAYQLSGPYTYKNLAVYLIHSSSKISDKRLIPLSEALDNRLVTIHETGEVNRLTAQNHSQDTYVFIQSGDMVKGGRQDRTLAQDLILPPKSKKIALDAFCVEHGRWRQRGKESASTFSSSKKQLSSKALKLAAKKAKSQQEVWQAVAAEQQRLGRKVGKSVQNPTSATSLQLSLEDKTLEKNRSLYQQALLPMGRREANAVGFADAIGGHFNAADIFGSPDLFQKLWPKLIEVAANEAIALEDSNTAVAVPQSAAVRDQILDALATPKKEEPSGHYTRRKSSDTQSNYVFETRDEKDQLIHLNIIKK